MFDSEIHTNLKKNIVSLYSSHSPASYSWSHFILNLLWSNDKIKSAFLCFTKLNMNESEWSHDLIKWGEPTRHGWLFSFHVGIRFNYLAFIYKSISPFWVMFRQFIVAIFHSLGVRRRGLGPCDSTVSFAPSYCKLTKNSIHTQRNAWTIMMHIISYSCSAVSFGPFFSRTKHRWVKQKT